MFVRCLFVCGCQLRHTYLFRGPVTLSHKHIVTIAKLYIATNKIHVEKYDSVKISGFNDILKIQVDESPLVYSATVVSDGSHFDLSTALCHVISVTCYAVNINASSL